MSRQIMKAKREKKDKIKKKRWEAKIRRGMISFKNRAISNNNYYVSFDTSTSCTTSSYYHYTGTSF